MSTVQEVEDFVGTKPTIGNISGLSRLSECSFSDALTQTRPLTQRRLMIDA